MGRMNKSARRSAADKAKGIDQTDSSLHKPLITGVKRKNKMRAVVLRDLAQNVRSDKSGLKLDTDDVVLVNLSAQS